MFALHISTSGKIHPNCRIKTFIPAMITLTLNRKDNKNCCRLQSPRL
jgi:hypothetical protein